MTETNIKADGKITKSIDKEFISMQVEQNIMGYGIMILRKANIRDSSVCSGTFNIFFYYKFYKGFISLLRHI
jgi:hypothetical protein